MRNHRLDLMINRLYPTINFCRLMKWYHMLTLDKYLSQDISIQWSLHKKNGQKKQQPFFFFQLKCALLYFKKKLSTFLYVSSSIFSKFWFVWSLRLPYKLLIIFSNISLIFCPFLAEASINVICYCSMKLLI